MHESTKITQESSCVASNDSPTLSFPYTCTLITLLLLKFSELSLSLISNLQTNLSLFSLLQLPIFSFLLQPSYFPTLLPSFTWLFKAKQWGSWTRPTAEVTRAGSSKSKELVAFAWEGGEKLEAWLVATVDHAWRCP